MRSFMGNRIKLSIGEFSKLCGVTVKTLRHYQKIGLLCPNEVDKWTKYRYYTVGQMQKMMQVRSMKNLGFSLEEITDLFDSECHRPDAEMLGIKIAQSEKELLKLQARITALKSMLIELIYHILKVLIELKLHLYFPSLLSFKLILTSTVSPLTKRLITD